MPHGVSQALIETIYYSPTWQASVTVLKVSTCRSFGRSHAMKTPNINWIPKNIRIHQTTTDYIGLEQHITLYSELNIIAS